MPIRFRVFLGLLLAATLWAWIAYFRFQPDDESDYGSVSGTLVSANEQILSQKVGREAGYLDIHIRESPICFRVPEDGYFDHFHREAFFAEVHPGATLRLVALKSEIASPSTPLIGSTPTIFVRGVAARGRNYCTVQDHIAWQQKNNGALLLLAVGGTVIAPIIYFGVKRQGNRIRR